MSTFIAQLDELKKLIQGNSNKCQIYRGMLDYFINTISQHESLREKESLSDEDVKLLEINFHQISTHLSSVLDVPSSYVRAQFERSQLFAFCKITNKRNLIYPDVKKMQSTWSNPNYNWKDRKVKEHNAQREDENSNSPIVVSQKPEQLRDKITSTDKKAWLRSGPRKSLSLSMFFADSDITGLNDYSSPTTTQQTETTKKRKAPSQPFLPSKMAITNEGNARILFPVKFGVEYDSSAMDRFDLVEIAKIDVIQTDGCIAKAFIPAQVRLGYYVGERISAKLADEKDYDGSYVIELNNRIFINAKKKGGVARFYNHSQVPNATYAEHVVDGKKYIQVVTTKPIAKGEQILVNYGPKYEFASDIRLVFFHNSDTDKTSAELFEQHRQEYGPPVSNVFLPVYTPLDRNPLGIEATDYIYLPNYISYQDHKFSVISPILSPNLPILMADSNLELLSTSETERVVPILLMSYLADSAAVKSLLEANADPNIQLLFAGYSPLHLVLLSAIENGELTERHKKVFKLLVEAGASLYLKDDESKTVLNYALDFKTPEIINFIFQFASGSEKSSALMIASTNEFIDPGLQAIMDKKYDHALTILKNIPASKSGLTNYLNVLKENILKELSDDANLAVSIERFVHYLKTLPQESSLLFFGNQKTMKKITPFFQNLYKKLGVVAPREESVVTQAMDEIPHLAL